MWQDIKAALVESSKLMRLAAEETLWPTRCVICDMPGELICHSCHLHLPYIDQLKACPTCGAAFGKTICCECNHFILDWKHLKCFPLDECISSVALTPESRRIVTCYKDRGEQRLAQLIAYYMADAMPRSWFSHSCFIPIPTRKRAKRERGFDHMKLIAQELHDCTHLACLNLLQPGARKDQRALGGQERLQNMSHSFFIQQEHWQQYEQDLHECKRLILIDDVMTTGATLFSAAETLAKQFALSNEAVIRQDRNFSKQSRIPKICGLTFIRA